MEITFIFIAFLIIQRLVELFIARHNTQRLIAKGAKEFASKHYPLIVAIHSLWILAIVVFGWEQSLNLFWLSVYGALQGFRLWILGSLGTRWTTRIIILNEPLVACGPYKFIKHPNYILVVAEIIVAPMVLGLWCVAAVFTLLNALILYIRIPAENAALATISNK